MNTGTEDDDLGRPKGTSPGWTRRSPAGLLFLQTHSQASCNQGTLLFPHRPMGNHQNFASLGSLAAQSFWLCQKPMVREFSGDAIISQSKNGLFFFCCYYVQCYSCTVVSLLTSFRLSHRATSVS